MQNENRFCVYVHRNKLTNEVFYVGSGTEDRSKQRKRKSKSWNEYVAINGFYPEIVCRDMSKGDSLEMEDLLIEMCEGLVNKLKPPVTGFKLTKEILDLFYYDETSPTFLRWKKARYKTRIKDGSQAGCLTTGLGKTEKSKVTVNRKSMLVHRIIYTLHYGDIKQNYVIDHIDGDPRNNNINNLREVTPAVNSRNVKSVRNKSGFIGVRYHKRERKWLAFWHENLVQQSKGFSIRMFGEDAFRLACEYRAMKIKELNKQGAGYTERHSEI